MIKNRKRAENFSEGEKEMCRLLVQEYLSIVESKANDLKIIEKKVKAWQNISESMKASGFDRTPKQLKEQWARMKMTCTKNINLFKRQRQETGNKGPLKEPDEFDFLVKEMIPQEFEEETIVIDSNDIHLLSEKTKEQEDDISVSRSLPSTSSINGNKAAVTETPLTKLRRLPKSSAIKEDIFTARKAQISSELSHNDEVMNLRKEVERMNIEKVQLEIKHLHERENRDKQIHELKIKMLEMNLQKSFGNAANFM